MSLVRTDYSKEEIETMATATSEIRDEVNPKFVLQGTATELLVQAASGRIDLNELARQELANRGLGRDGEWIGFEAAANYWNERAEVAKVSGV